MAAASQPSRRRAHARDRASPAFRATPVFGLILLSLGGCASSDDGFEMPRIQDLNPFAEKQVPLPGKRMAVLQQDNKVGDLASADQPLALPLEQTNEAWTQPGGSANNALGHLALPATIKTAWEANAGAGSTGN